MAAHPVPPLPSGEEDVEGTRLAFLKKGRSFRESPDSLRPIIVRGSDDYLALFDDTNEVIICDVSHQDNNRCDLELPAHEGKPLKETDAPARAPKYDSYDLHSSITCPDTPSQALLLTATRNVFSNHFDTSWTPSGRSDAFHGKSLDPVRNYIPSTSRARSCNPDSIQDAPTDEDDQESTRIPLVRFVDTLAYLYTTSPPTPPPHLKLPSPSASFHSFQPSLFVSSSPPNFQTFHQSGPYGPRIPPWGTTENLNRERHVRSDLRALTDTLERRFVAESRRRETRRRRDEEAIRRGWVRTQGEELREAVKGVYPEFEIREARRKCGWSCVVM